VVVAGVMGDVRVDQEIEEAGSLFGEGILTEIREVTKVEIAVKSHSTRTSRSIDNGHR
jgi:hypothetical protein